LSDIIEGIPEVPALAEARIVLHPQTGRECLLATDEDGARHAFGFEVEGTEPGLLLVDPALWLEGEAQEAVEDAWADDWLPAISVHPVGDEWLGRIKEAHPEAFHTWWAQAHYEEGGEEGSG
jgi:hypothetical protein